MNGYVHSSSYKAYNPDTWYSYLYRIRNPSDNRSRYVLKAKPTVALLTSDAH